jgi:AcrR family transcriptional regulator
MRARDAAAGADGRERQEPAAERSEQKLERLLGAAARLMAEKGYGQTSIRQVARETNLSLAGIYYYFENKEDLLYQIQHRTFSALLIEQEQVLATGGSPEQKLRRLIRNHLAYFTSHGDELKICTFELQSLQGERYRAIELLRRRYFRCLADVVGELLDGNFPGGVRSRDERERLVRHHTLFMFGMLNWIFMWFDPQRDEPVERLGDEMLALVLRGLQGGGS